MSKTLFAAGKDRFLFVESLLAWFRGHARDLPWRRDYAPYKVWVSEIMLQQTRMDRVVTYFDRWMRLFPTPAHVARAPEEAVLKAWEGLGYYSRARNLRLAAQRVGDEHGGVFPAGPAAIRALPGIGEYTAGAIASIAFNLPEPAVDANVLRVFSRLCDIDVPLDHAGVKNFVRETVRSLMPEGRARDFSQALMELGALVCGKKARCEACPVSGYCEALRLDTVAKRPKKKRALGYTRLEMATGMLWRNGRFFIQKRPPYGVWAGLWEFPGGCLEEGESPEQALLREFKEETELSVSISGKAGVIRHSYTTCRVTMHAYFCGLDAAGSKGEPAPVLHAATEGLWITPAEADNFAFPAGHRKLLNLLWEQGIAGFSR